MAFDLNFYFFEYLIFVSVFFTVFLRFFHQSWVHFLKIFVIMEETLQKIVGIFDKSKSVSISDRFGLYRTIPDCFRPFQTVHAI